MTTCTHPKAERRDEALCGTCFGEQLLTEPLSHRKPGEAMPTYSCCGAGHLGRPDEHHHCASAATS